MTIGVSLDQKTILDGEISNEHDAAFDSLLEIEDEALQRGKLFEAMQDRLVGPENRALGAIKEVVFEDQDLPEEREAAIECLEGGNGLPRNRGHW